MRNGSGTFNLLTNSWSPATNGTPATAADWQALINDVAAAITQSLSKDGQTAMTGNLPAGGNKITGLAAGTTAGDSVRYEQLPATVNWRGYIDGLQMSASGSTMTTSAGVGMDSTNVNMLTLDSAISKTAVGWAVGTGAGGLDTGAIANSTWYHFYLIRRPDTGVVDSIFSTSASAPTLPANYTQYRRYGSGKTDGAGQWTAFVQTGDNFAWYTPILDITSNNPGTSAVSRTLSVPTGIKVYARFNGGTTNGASSVFPYTYFSSLDTADLSPSATLAPLSMANYSANNAGGSENNISTHTVKTNTSAQIRSRISASDANCNIRIATLGWIDSRGRDA